MTDVNELVDWLRAQLDDEDQGTLDALSRDWRPDGANSCQVYSAAQDGTNRTIARCRNGHDDDFANSRHIARWDPTRVLAETAAKRQIIDTVMSWRHVIVEDCWYTCAAATEERDGEVSCRDDVEPGDPCTCGLDRKQLAILGPLALPPADRPGFREEWRV